MIVIVIGLLKTILSGLYRHRRGLGFTWSRLQRRKYNIRITKLVFHAKESPIRTQDEVLSLASSRTEDVDMLSATNSEVESAMNHRRRRAVLLNNIFSKEAFNAFNLGDAYIRAAQGGLAWATDQYTKDIRVRKFDKHV